MRSLETAPPPPICHPSCSSHHDDVTMAEAGAGEMLGTVDNGASKGSVF